MRAPRYQFPDEVRTTTGAMASQMVRTGTTVATPEELDAWIAQAPEMRESLERGGYGTSFDARDLLPLLHAAVVRAGGRLPGDDEPPPPSRTWWPLAVGLLLVLGLAIVLFALLVGRG